MTRPVRVRIAPSPTGYTHVGNLRTAVFNWLWARKNDGVFIWRVEDTDRSRFVEDALTDVRDSLAWLGIEPDEGPFTGGDYGPYVQSERLERYAEAAEWLLAAGGAYRCFCPPRGEVEAAVEDEGEHGGFGGYDRRCRDLSAEVIAERLAEGAPFTIRLKMPLEGELSLEDAIHGQLVWQAEHFTDPIIMKSDGFPTYHLAVCVDDAAMEISHVMRADEWMGSSPYHILINRALGFEPPIYVHVPMVLNPDGRGKLSKRKTVTYGDGGPAEVTRGFVDPHGMDDEEVKAALLDMVHELMGSDSPSSGVAMVQAREFRAAGYLPEAMFNYLVLLGWSYSGDEEIFTPEQAIERFELQDIHKSGARWDPEKLDWMNGHYIRALEPEDLAQRIRPFLEDAGFTPQDDAVLLSIAHLVQERLSTLSEAPDWVAWLWREVEPAAEDLISAKLGAEGSAAALAAARGVLADVDEWSVEAIETALRGLADTLGVKAGPLFGPIRVAVTGGTVAPPLFETLALLARDVVVERLRRAHDIVVAA